MTRSFTKQNARLTATVTVALAILSEMFRQVLATLMLVGMFGSITGCNTVAGMGKDIERAGQATQDTAADVKRKM